MEEREKRRVKGGRAHALMTGNMRSITRFLLKLCCGPAASLSGDLTPTAFHDQRNQSMLRDTSNTDRQRTLLQRSKRKVIGETTPGAKGFDLDSVSAADKEMLGDLEQQVDHIRRTR